MLADLKGIFCCEQSSWVPDEDFCPWEGQRDIITGALASVETLTSSYGFYMPSVQGHFRSYLPILYSSRLYPRWLISRFTPSAAGPFQLGQVSGHRGLYLQRTHHTVAHHCCQQTQSNNPTGNGQVLPLEKDFIFAAVCESGAADS